MKEDILMIAALSRRACEEYNHIHQHFPLTLKGMCGLASHFLFNNLQEYEPLFILGLTPVGSHCWVKVGNVNIDITATQFSQCSPIFNYNGGLDKHPILLKEYGRQKVVGPYAPFPHQWKFYEAYTHKEIAILMKGWSTETSYRGLTRKRLDNFYKVN